jgi:hypothetical protein
MAQTYRTDGIEGKVVPLYRAPALTAEERQAIEDAVAELTPGPIAATLRKLLERLK